MEATTVLAILGGLVVVAAIVFMIRNPGKGFRGKAGYLEIEVKGQEPPGPGAVIKGVTSTEGSATATDETGRGALVADTHVKGDITATNKDPRGSDPKA